MSTLKKYLIDDSTTQIVKIVEVHDGDECFVRLNETLFHCQGGGQKADKGTIGTATVLHVRQNGDFVDHIVDTIDGLDVDGEYEISVNKDWRLANAAYHTAGHLLAGIVEIGFPGIKAVSGHQWPGEARVEFDGTVSDIDGLRSTVTKKLIEDIEAGLDITMVGDPFKDRAIKIGPYAAIPCGGTHLSNTKYLDNIELGKIKSSKGKMRIRYGLK